MNLIRYELLRVWYDLVVGEFLLNDPMQLFDQRLVLRRLDMNTVRGNSIGHETVGHAVLRADKADRVDSRFGNCFAVTSAMWISGTLIAATTSL